MNGYLLAPGRGVRKWGVAVQKYFDPLSPADNKC